MSGIRSLAPAPQRQPNICAEGARGRVQQFVAAATTRKDEVVDARLRALCPQPACWSLLARLSPYDRRHALAVYDLLIASGCDDEDVLMAGVFHDIGKADEVTRVRLPDRIGLVLGCALAPSVIKRQAAAPPDNRMLRGLYLAAEHAQLGAEAARQVGFSSRTCALIAAHDGETALDDPALALLTWADRRAL